MLTGKIAGRLCYLSGEFGRLKDGIDCNIKVIQEN